MQERIDKTGCDCVGYVEELRAIIGHRPIILVGAIVIILDESGRILLQKRKFPYGSWGIPGGLMELEESTEDAARREIFEETQLELGQLHLVNVFSGPQNHCIAENGDEFFVVTVAYYTQEARGRLTVNDSESLAFAYFDPFKMPDGLVTTHQTIIRDFVSTHYHQLRFHPVSSTLPETEMLMHKECIVRKCEKRDLEHIKGLFREFVSYHESLDAYFGKVDNHDVLFETYILSHMDTEKSRVLVAEHDSETIGYCLGYIRERPPVYPEIQYGYIDNFCVSDRWQSKGIGTEIFLQMARWFQEQGIQEIELSAAISNPKAMRFWRKMGFTPFNQMMRLLISDLPLSR